ncbi:MAG: hypothetical protein HQK66_00930 [Desulfamplus sp.]|nr:hypothetical protein [Desulfamplus sp.]
MPDTTNDDTLISQDDVDKLLSAGSIEEAEEALSGADDDLGELSQDDIDNLLNASSTQDDEDAFSGADDDDEDVFSGADDDVDDALAGADDDLGELSQDDIDNLLNASSTQDDEDAFSGADDDDEDAFSGADEDVDDALSGADDDLGELSQDDIDRLLNASSFEEDDPEIPEDDPEIPEDDLPDGDADDFDGEQDDFDLVSQDDIDKLMSTESMDDLDNLEVDLEEDPLVDEDGPGDFSGASRDDDDDDDDDQPIDESQAWDIENCLVTQDDIDELLSSDNDDDLSVESDDDLDDLFASGPDDGDSPGTDLSDDAGTRDDPRRKMDGQDEDEFLVDLTDGEGDDEFALDDAEDLSQADLDALLGDAEDGDDDLESFSSDDIDEFLSEDDAQPLDSEPGPVDDGAGGGGRDLISQDDIDALLAGTDEEDEDLLADMEQDEDLDISSDFSTDDIDPGGEEDDSGPVLLEPDDSLEAGDAPGDEIAQLGDQNLREQKERVKSPIVRIVILVILFMIAVGGATAGIYFFLLKDRLADEPPSYDTSLLQPTVKDEEDIHEEKVDVQIEEEDIFQPGKIVLEDFVVFTPEQDEVTTYVAADIAIDYSYKSVGDEITARTPFYRHIIYEAIKNVLREDVGVRLTGDDIVKAVKKELDMALPGKKVDKVTFVVFITG